MKEPGGQALRMIYHHILLIHWYDTMIAELSGGMNAWNA